MILNHAWWEVFAYARPETFQGVITPANTDFQMMRIPWPNPDAAKTTGLAIHLSNSTASAAVVAIWDKDLTADAAGFTTAGWRGTLANPILRFNVPASSDIIAELMTRPYFQTGLTCQSTQNNMWYSINVAHTGMGA